MILMVETNPSFKFLSLSQNPGTPRADTVNE